MTDEVCVLQHQHFHVWTKGTRPCGMQCKTRKIKHWSLKLRLTTGVKLCPSGSWQNTRAMLTMFFTVITSLPPLIHSFLLASLCHHLFQKQASQIAGIWSAFIFCLWAHLHFTCVLGMLHYHPSLHKHFRSIQQGEKSLLHSNWHIIFN